MIHSNRRINSVCLSMSATNRRKVFCPFNFNCAALDSEVRGWPMPASGIALSASVAQILTRALGSVHIHSKQPSFIMQEDRLSPPTHFHSNEQGLLPYAPDNGEGNKFAKQGSRKKKVSRRLSRLEQYNFPLSTVSTYRFLIK